jgi:hypothetical protein
LIYTNDLGFTKAIVPETITTHNLVHVVDADGDSYPDFLVDDAEPEVQLLHINCDIYWRSIVHSYPI